ncbi:Probable RNA-directed DNA polymerase from transposon BS [Anthophora plagiata]
MEQTNLILCSWNANGIRNKISDIIEFLNRFKIDMLLINETKLSDKETLKIRKYNCERFSRPNAAGGVLILIKNNIPYKLVKLKNKTVIENVCIKLANNIHIVAAYNRPIVNITNKDIDTLLNVASKVLLIGDLNCRHNAWKCHINNRNGQTLYNYCQHNNCSILYPDEATHYPENGSTPTTIDLAINKNVISITGPQVLHELVSDHKPILFNIGNIYKNKDTSKATYNYKQADWKKFRQTLDEKININNSITSKESIEQEVTNITNSIQTAMEETILKINRKREEEQLPPQIIDPHK